MKGFGLWAELRAESVRGAVAFRRRRLRPGGLRVCALGCIAALVMVPASAGAEDSSGDMTKEAGLGTAAVLTSLLYGPAKLCYAVGGLIVGGLAFAFSGGDAEVAKVVLTPSVRGDYVVTPSNLRGEEPLEFFGRDPGYRPESTQVAAGSEEW